MRFLILVAGIMLACLGGAMFVIERNPLLLILCFAGLAITAGEGFKIAMIKEMEADKLEESEAEMIKDLKEDAKNGL